ncbi:MAG: DUF177 domain-containing protein [Ilumatobacter sp.]|uniref:YceD family protein n=1 Tax=Ilumatobacter sp. TaxID=1967498 RepID=UPI003C72499C
METTGTRELRINAVELLRQPGSTRQVDVAVTGTDLDVVHEALAGDLEVDVLLTAMNDGIVVRGEVRVPWSRPCRRCLRALSGVAAAEIDELHQVEIIDEDAYPILDNQLNLAPTARQSALLELDEERLCTEDCAGLCAQCGIDLNTQTCDCDNEVKDHRWAALDGLVLDD